MGVFHLAKRGKSTLDGLSREVCRVIWGCRGVAPGEEMFYIIFCFAFVKKAPVLYCPVWSTTGHAIALRPSSLT